MNYISFMLHYHFMVVMTVRRWNIYRLFREHFIQYIPWRAPRLKDTLSFCKLCPESQFLNQPIRTFFPSTFNTLMKPRSPLPSLVGHSSWNLRGNAVWGNRTVTLVATICEMGMGMLHRCLGPWAWQFSFWPKWFFFSLNYFLNGFQDSGVVCVTDVAAQL